jgi:hypothetical protein
MNRELLILRLLQALIVVQILAGILSIFTLNIGRSISVFGSAALIYLGITVIQQLVAIRELLAYSSGQQSVRKEAASPSASPTSMLSQLRKNKKETAPISSEAPVRNPRQDVARETRQEPNEPRVYAARGQAPQSD